MRRMLLAAGLLAVTSWIGAQPWGGGAAATAATPARIIDLTLVCRPTGVGYPDSVRFMTVGGNPFQAGGYVDTSPQISVSNGGTAPDSGVDAGVRTRASSGHATGEMWFTRTRCQRTKIRVPLASRGLTGGPAESSGANYRCDAPARVLIRVRAVFKRPTALSRPARAPYLSVARGPVATGYLAIATLRGRKPIYFGSVDDRTGGARVFAAPSRCARR